MVSCFLWPSSAAPGALPTGEHREELRVQRVETPLFNQYWKPTGWLNGYLANSTESCFGNRLALTKGHCFDIDRHVLQWHLAD